MPRRVLNTKLVCILLGTLLVAGVAVHVVHGFQVRRMSGQLLVRATQAEATGDTAKALDLLKRHLFFDPGDSDALARYARVLDSPAATPADRADLVSALERLVHQEPEKRNDEHRRLATVLWEEQDYPAAIKHINAGCCGKCLRTPGCCSCAGSARKRLAIRQRLY